MSKRDIILFDIGRKTTGFSEKNLRGSSEPAPLSTFIHSIPALSFGSHTEQTSHFSYGLLRGIRGTAPSRIFRSANSGHYLEYIRDFLYENHSHLAPL